MSLRGIGDRWLAGERIEGVLFGRGDTVSIAGGERAGERGTIVLLLDLAPEPLYLVELAAGRRDLKVRQSALRPPELTGGD